MHVDDSEEYNLFSTQPLTSKSLEPFLRYLKPEERIIVKCYNQAKTSMSGTILKLAEKQAEEVGKKKKLLKTKQPYSSFEIKLKRKEYKPFDSTMELIEHHFWNGINEVYEEKVKGGDPQFFMHFIESGRGRSFGFEPINKAGYFELDLTLPPEKQIISFINFGLQQGQDSALRRECLKHSIYLLEGGYLEEREEDTLEVLTADVFKHLTTQMSKYLEKQEEEKDKGNENLIDLLGE